MFQAWLIIIGLMIVAGIGLRLWQWRLAPVQLHKVSPAAASTLVAEFIQSSYDGQFGYPSGLFSIDEVNERKIVASEFVGKGSHFVQILKGLYRAILSIGLGCGCLGAYLGFCLALVLTPLLLYAALTETLLKYLLRSRIVAELDRAGDGTKVAFTLRGPVALLVGKRLVRAFHAPVLPPRVAMLAGIEAAGPTAGPAAGAGAAA